MSWTTFRTRVDPLMSTASWIANIKRQDVKRTLVGCVFRLELVNAGLLIFRTRDSRVEVNVVARSDINRRPRARREVPLRDSHRVRRRRTARTFQLMPFLCLRLKLLTKSVTTRLYVLAPMYRPPDVVLTSKAPSSMPAAKHQTPSTRV